MKWTRKSQRQSLVVLFLAVLFSGAALSDEWTARHGLVLPPGAPDLGVPAAPDAVFLSGPQTSDRTEKWRAGIKQWRKDRLAGVCYHDTSPNQRPELASTQHVIH